MAWDDYASDRRRHPGYRVPRRLALEPLFLQRLLMQSEIEAWVGLRHLRCCGLQALDLGRGRDPIASMR